MTNRDGSVAGNTSPGPRPFAPRGDLRLLFMADLSSYAREPYTSDPATPEQLHRLVDDFALSGAGLGIRRERVLAWTGHFGIAPDPQQVAHHL